jgi:hypothetical protein
VKAHGAMNKRATFVRAGESVSRQCLKSSMDAAEVHGVTDK